MNHGKRLQCVVRSAADVCIRVNIPKTRYAFQHERCLVLTDTFSRLKTDGQYAKDLGRRIKNKVKHANATTGNKYSLLVV